MLYESLFSKDFYGRIQIIELPEIQESCRAIENSIRNFQNKVITSLKRKFGIKMYMLSSCFIYQVLDLSRCSLSYFELQKHVHISNHDTRLRYKIYKLCFFIKINP